MLQHSTWSFTYNIIYLSAFTAVRGEGDVMEGTALNCLCVSILLLWGQFVLLVTLCRSLLSERLFGAFRGRAKD